MAGAVRATLLAALGALAASSCGGGGSSPPAPSPPVANRPPVFTSATAVSVPENVNGVAYTVQASDPDGGTLTFGVLTGVDAGRFNFDLATRQVRFNQSPDFETPLDDDRNNVYRITFSASDGVTTVLHDVQITVTNVVNGFRVRRLATGLNQPMFVAGLPDNSGRIIVVERAGRIRVMDANTGAIQPTDFLNLTGQIDTTNEKALAGVAFSPTFATDRTFYLHMNPTTSNTTEIRQYRALATAYDVADPATANVILSVPQPATTNHKGGFIAFDPPGRLLIGLGDGGGAGDPDNNAQNPNALLGKILRINPSTDAFPNDPNRDYAIPTDNPFATAGGAPEVWAMGMRNPFRGSIDGLSNSVFIGDVGQGAIEEVDRLLITATVVLNFGWPRREGTQPYNGGADSPSFLAPSVEYTHGSGPLQGASITGGVVYRGPIDDLQAQYIFADFVSNNIWTVPVASLVQGFPTPTSSMTNRNTAFTPDVGAINSIVAFGTDEARNVYIVDLGGEIFKLEPAT